jgi:hypothetical protein
MLMTFDQISGFHALSCESVSEGYKDCICCNFESSCILESCISDNRDEYVMYMYLPRKSGMILLLYSYSYLVGFIGLFLTRSGLKILCWTRNSRKFFFFLLAAYLGACVPK